MTSADEPAAERARSESTTATPGVKETQPPTDVASVDAALEQAGAAPTRPVAAVPQKHLAWMGAYALLVAAFAVLYELLDMGTLDAGARFQRPLQRAALGSMAIVVVLGVARAVDAFLIGRLRRATSRYNLRRLKSLFAGIAIFFIVLSILSATWYTAVVSLGLISLVLGFALQTPITSLIGWVYILVRAPYQVGDRVRIGDATGDVIDVSYLDTTLWEFGGEYLTTDHPSGRIIKFPNSTVLTTPVFNYSWPLFPYIWNEVKFQIAYQSDLDFVAKTMQRIAEKELGREMGQHVAVYRDLLAKTPVDALEVREKPSVFFRVSDNTWLEAIVRYLVEPRQAGRVKNRLIREMLEQLNAEPARVLFPKQDMR